MHIAMSLGEVERLIAQSRPEGGDNLFSVRERLEAAVCTGLASQGTDGDPTAALLTLPALEGVVADARCRVAAGEDTTRAAEGALASHDAVWLDTGDPAPAGPDDEMAALHQMLSLLHGRKPHPLGPLFVAAENADIERSDSLERTCLAFWDRMTPVQQSRFLGCEATQAVIRASGG